MRVVVISFVCARPPLLALRAAGSSPPLTGPTFFATGSPSGHGNRGGQQQALVSSQSSPRQRTGSATGADQNSALLLPPPPRLAGDSNNAGKRGSSTGTDFRAAVARGSPRGGSVTNTSASGVCVCIGRCFGCVHQDIPHSSLSSRLSHVAYATNSVPLYMYVYMQLFVCIFFWNRVRLFWNRVRHGYVASDVCFSARQRCSRCAHARRLEKKRLTILAAHVLDLSVGGEVTPPAPNIGSNGFPPPFRI